MKSILQVNARPPRHGFTLVELLVVISVILIVSSIIFVGGGGGDSAKLSSSQRILSGIAQGARGQALLKGSETRIIIYSDSESNEEDEKKLRYFGIIYGDPESLSPSGSPTEWIAATQGTNLPEGIYFDSELSESNDWSGDTMQLEYPRASPQSEGSGAEYYYYAYNSNGTLKDTGNPWMVIRSGTLQPDGGNMIVDFSDEAKSEFKAALIFRRAGTTTMVSDPEDIKP